MMRLRGKMNWTSRQKMEKKRRPFSYSPHCSPQYATVFEPTTFAMPPGKGITVKDMAKHSGKERLMARAQMMARVRRARLSLGVERDVAE